jgi:uncharacterized membrane protein YgaE (UPF0421/DUF939 family)
MKKLHDHKWLTALSTLVAAVILVLLFGEAGVLLSLVGVIVVILVLLPESVTGWKFQ